MYNLGLSAILWEIISSDAWWIVCNVKYSGLKWQLSGDAPQGSWSSMNDVNKVKAVRQFVGFVGY